MALHHRPHIDDIRSAYDGERSQSDFTSDRSYSNSHSGSSGKASRSQPIIHSSSLCRSVPRRQPSAQTADNHATPARYFPDREPQQSPRASSETYASTCASQQELQEDVREYQVPQYTPRSHEPSAIPATPSEFSELFPSGRKLVVHHDDSTLDGNMNLRIDTEVLLQGGRRGQMTLFHLRMHDLRNREFSLRRYCRDSGREVCHSQRKRQASVVEKRPGLQRSLSNAFNGIRPRIEQKRSGSVSSLKRHDSGYGSMHAIEAEKDGGLHSSEAPPKPAQQQKNTVKLEFSNYAQVSVKRVGGRSSRRYEFEYWGTQYSWRRIHRKFGHRQQTSYQLHAAGKDRPLAHIVPTLLSSSQAAEEKSKGGWIPPCTMWIADRGITAAPKDVADVVIASGLIALVDDSIKAHFRAQDSRQLLIPVPKLHIGVEYVGPKRLLSEIFRRGSISSSGSGGGDGGVVDAQHGRRPLMTRPRPASSGPGASGPRAPGPAVRQWSYEY